MGLFDSLFGKRKEAPPPPKRVCPACGQNNAPTYRLCVSCGLELVPGAAAEKKQADERLRVLQGAKKNAAAGRPVGVLALELTNGKVTGKKCATCSNEVSLTVDLGQECEHCGVYWTETRSRKSSPEAR